MERRVIVLKDNTLKKPLGSLAIKLSANEAEVKCELLPFDRKNALIVVSLNGELFSFRIDGAAARKTIKTRSNEITGVSCAVFSDNTPILFGKTGNENTDLKGLCDYEKNHCNESYKENIQKTGGEPLRSDGGTRSEEYDDEAISTENYYGLNYDERGVYDENVGTFKRHSEKEQKEIGAKRIFSDEKNACDEKVCGYYEKIEDKLCKILSSHERCGDLEKVISGGKFVKIYYDETRYYVVGTIKADEKIKYIAYGIKGTYGNVPPPLEKYCRFIPLSEFDLLSEGYYVIFQNALTGEPISRR